MVSRANKSSRATWLQTPWKSRPNKMTWTKMCAMDLFMMVTADPALRALHPNLLNTEQVARLRWRRQQDQSANRLRTGVSARRLT
jgi:hypothetical protein